MRTAIRLRPTKQAAHVRSRARAARTRSRSMMAKTAAACPSMPASITALIIPALAGSYAPWPRRSPRRRGVGISNNGGPFQSFAEAGQGRRR